jgi:hypothetical protein
MFALFFALFEFALILSRPLIFALVISCSCVLIWPGQDSQNRTDRKGQAEQDGQKKTAIMTGQTG